MPRAAATPTLERLLALVPWVLAHPEEATVSGVCERFKITPEELAADLELLFMCGLPPFGPGDLIEAWIEGDRVHIGAAEHLSRPLRLTRWEAVRLLVAGRALASLGDAAGSDSLRRALAKLESALSPEEAAAARDLAARVAVDLEGTGAEPLLAGLREAIDERRRLRITYYSFGRDEISTREIDPYVVFSALGNWYVSAHDHATGEDRVFRVDRIKEAEPTGESFTIPDGVDLEAVAAAGRRLFVPSPRDREAVVDLGPRAGWVREITPHEKAEPLPGGWTRIVVRTPTFEWLARLVLRLGEDVRIAAPDDLAERVREVAAAALSRYSA